jgi:CheY-like chemotaxis protein
MPDILPCPEFGVDAASWNIDPSPVFVVHIHFCEKHHECPRHDTDHPMTSENPRQVVLAVDDEAIILWGTAALLESLGYDVVRANSGMAALQLILNRPDIGTLVTDFQMPIMSGVELAEAVRTVRPDLPVIIATGHTSLQSRTGHAWTTISKPFTRDELAHALSSAIARQPSGASG